MDGDNGDLVVWAGMEEHKGIYQAEVTSSDGAGTVILETAIRVSPMRPSETIKIEEGTSGEDPEDVFPDADGTGKPKPINEYTYTVRGFTPDGEYCQNPSWMIIDRDLNLTKDITKHGNLIENELLYRKKYSFFKYYCRTFA